MRDALAAQAIDTFSLKLPLEALYAILGFCPADMRPLTTGFAAV
jgi:hypothetical protein